MRKISSLGSLFLMVLLAGCGGGVTLIYDTISPSAAQNLDAGQSITLTAAVVNDPSNAGVTWSVTGAGTLSNQTPTSVVYTAPTPITAAASSGVTAIPVKNTLYAAATTINLSPGLAIGTTSLPSGTIGVAYNSQIQATGGSGTLTYAIVSGSLPAGLTLSSTGLISGTPTAAASSTFTISVTDGATTPVTVTRQLTLNVTAPTLTITTATIPNGVTGTTYSAQLASTGGIAPYSWKISSGSLPSGLTINATTGLISGTPTAAGTYSFTVSESDTETVPQVATKSYVVSIVAALTITTTTLPGGAAVKHAYTATLAATGGTNPLTWSLAAGSSLPAGLTLSSAGVISGTPTTAGSTTFTVQVTDTSVPQQTATMTYTLQVVLSTLAITTTSLPQGTANVTYPTTTLTYSGGNPPVTWALATGSSLPTGLTLSAAGVISGTPTAAGTFSFTVQATDTTPATVSATLSITVVALAPLTLVTTTVPAGNLDTPYSTTLTATGGAQPYTWSITAGALPVGLTLSSAGVLSGTPLVPGTYNFTVQVKDSQPTPATASRAFTLTIGTTLPTGSNNAELNGSYAFLVQGFRVNGAAGAANGFAAIGSLTAAGAGTVTGVEDTNSAAGVTAAVAVTGTYTVGSDGRGFLVLTAGTTTNIYAIAVSNVSGGVAQSIAMTEFDNSAAATGGMNGAGFAKLQTVAAFKAGSVSGTYAFGLSGESPCSSCATGAKIGPLAAVGTFTADGVSAITAGAEDAGAYATNYTGVTFTGSFTTPSATSGRGTIHVTNTGTLFAAPPTDYTFVIVNAGEMLWMANDSHATNALLAGDVRAQTVTSYTASTLTGTLVGYESQGSGGDGSTTAPAALNAILSRVVVTGSGTATLAQDANRAGTVSSTSATAITYTTGTNGRTVLTTGGASNQVLYPYTANAGFALDQAATSAYPALITYEHVVATAPYPTLLSGSYAAGTLPTAAPATDASGVWVFALNTGGVNAGISGSVAMTLDSSAPSGTLSLGTASSALFAEDTTGRLTLDSTTSTAVQGVVYPITSTRALAIPATAGTTPVVTVLQQ